MRLGSMSANAEAAVENERPALLAILSMESCPRAASRVLLEIGRGWPLPIQDETKSPNPDLRRRSMKAPSPPGVSLIKATRPESSEVVLEVLRPNSVPACDRIASNVPMRVLLRF